MNAADVLISLFGVLTLLMGISVVFGMIYMVLSGFISYGNAKKMDRRQEKRFNKRYSNL